LFQFFTCEMTLRTMLSIDLQVPNYSFIRNGPLRKFAFYYQLVIVISFYYYQSNRIKKWHPLFYNLIKSLNILWLTEKM
jgi:hypothetical protein